MDAVPGQGVLEPCTVPRRQGRPVGVEPPQEGDEVLLGAAGRLLGVLARVLGLGARPVEGGDVGEQVEEAVLAGGELLVVGWAGGRQVPLLADERGDLGGVAVVPEQVGHQVGVDLLAARLGPGGPLDGQHGEVELAPRALGRREGRGRGEVPGRPDPHQRRTALHLRVGDDGHGGDEAVEGGADRGDHLHRLQDGHRVPGADLLPLLDEDLRDQRRPAGPHDEAVDAGDGVGDAVDLQPEGAGELAGDDPAPAPTAGDPSGVRTEPFDPHVDGDAVVDAVPV